MFPRHHETWELLVSVFDSTGKLFDFAASAFSQERVVLEPCLLWCCVRIKRRHVCQCASHLKKCYISKAIYFSMFSLFFPHEKVLWGKHSHLLLWEHLRRWNAVPGLPHVDGRSGWALHTRALIHEGRRELNSGSGPGSCTSWFRKGWGWGAFSNLH